MWDPTKDDCENVSTLTQKEEIKCSVHLETIETRHRNLAQTEGQMEQFNRHSDCRKMRKF